MKALFDFEPNFCPNCGIPAVHKRRTHSRWNYLLRGSVTCDCSLSYQRATTVSLLKAAQESEGDLQEIQAPDESFRRKVA
jgi:hypothetical protein